VNSEFFNQAARAGHTPEPLHRGSDPSFRWLSSELNAAWCNRQYSFWETPGAAAIPTLGAQDIRNK
jgi:hypothetical protein